MSKLKTELETLQGRKEDAEMQLHILEDAKERFIQEQKLEADLILLKENHDKELNALHEQHMQELVEKETMYNEDYAMKEKELREK